MPIARRSVLLASLLGVALPPPASAAGLGFSISVDGEGFVLNPVVRRIVVTAVEPNSAAAKAGIATGDEIVSVDGTPVQGRRANDLKALMGFATGRTKTLGLKRPTGEAAEARLEKPAS